MYFHLLLRIEHKTIIKEYHYTLSDSFTGFVIYYYLFPVPLYIFDSSIHTNCKTGDISIHAFWFFAIHNYNRYIYIQYTYIGTCFLYS